MKDNSNKYKELTNLASLYVNLITASLVKIHKFFPSYFVYMSSVLAIILSLSRIL